VEEDAGRWCDAAGDEERGRGKGRSGAMRAGCFFRRAAHAADVLTFHISIIFIFFLKVQAFKPYELPSPDL
jgi:hypothetical protein